MKMSGSASATYPLVLSCSHVGEFEQFRKVYTIYAIYFPCKVVYGLCLCTLQNDPKYQFFHGTLYLTFDNRKLKESQTFHSHVLKT